MITLDRLRRPRVREITNMVRLQVLALLIAQQAIGQETDYSQYVNPLIGGSGPFEGLACKSLDA